jgi:hypothetical protein
MNDASIVILTDRENRGTNKSGSDLGKTFTGRRSSVFTARLEEPSRKWWRL